MVLLSLGFPLAVAVAGVAALGPAPALAAFATLAALAALSLLLARLVIRRTVGPVQPNTVAFFHPAAAGGGGGERVLWAAVQAVQAAWPEADVWVYAGCEAGGQAPSAAALAAAAGAAFGLAPPRPVRPVPLPGAAAALDPASHPRLTLVTQSLAGAAVAWAGLRAAPPPALWIDTAGWAGAYPLAALAGSAVLAYVHYPLVSTDMLGRLRPASPSPGGAARAVVKAVYYYAVAAAYGCLAGGGAGGGAGAVMANSTWTARHVAALWWRAQPPALVHPPCGAAGLAVLPLARPVETLARPLLVCVAQFRPEKAQGLLLRAFAAARTAAAAALADPATSSSGAAAAQAVLASRLLFFGSVRPGGPDEDRVAGLRELAGELGLVEGGGRGPAPGAPAPRRRRRGKGGAAGTATSLAADGRGVSPPPTDPDPDAAAAADPAATPASLVRAWTRPDGPPVGFVVGAPRPVLAAALGAAAAGLHAMVDEHFGISVVEYMSAGAVPIAHASGGPASDIVLPEPPPGVGRGTAARQAAAAAARAPAAPSSSSSSSSPAPALPTGFLCRTEAEYAAAMAAVLGMPPADRDAMAARARARAARFSDAAFAAAFVAALAPAAVGAGLGAPVGRGGGGGDPQSRRRR